MSWRQKENRGIRHVLGLLAPQLEEHLLVVRVVLKEQGTHSQVPKGYLGMKNSRTSTLTNFCPEHWAMVNK
jgi:hypothetical protein